MYLRPVVRGATTENTEESKGESGPSRNNQLEVQEFSRGNARATAVLRVDYLEIRG